MKTIDKESIISFLKTNKEFLKENFGVISIGLIGSYARNEQNQKSDIDFLVELTEPRFDYLAGLMIYLEENFGKKVDIVTKHKYLKERFVRRVEKEIIYA